MREMKITPPSDLSLRGGSAIGRRVRNRFPALFEQFFGEPWDDPQIENLPRGGTPVGTECMHCAMPIRAGDQEVQMYATQQWGAGNQTLASLHRQCIDLFINPTPE
jgi:hypothetical protein